MLEIIGRLEAGILIYLLLLYFPLLPVLLY